MFKQEILSLMRDTIGHTPAAGSSASGKPIYLDGAEVAIPARIARKQRTIVIKTGKVAISQAQIWFASDIPEFNFRDRVRLPDGSCPTILMFERLPDEAGNLYLKVYL